MNVSPSRTRVSTPFRVALLVTIALAGCSSPSEPTSSPDSADVLSVVGGSELKDMLPILAEARKATGIDVRLTYTGSLDGADQIASGGGGDAAWFASDKYVALAGASSKVLEHKPVMLSPVIVGVRESVATRLGWGAGATVGWADIAQAAADGQFRFAMTSPTASNSGFSALVSLASALSGGQALSAETIDATALQGFFKGQALASGSSGFLSEAFVADQASLDGMVNYESVLMALNGSGQLREPLVLVYPSEGVVTADYPLMLLDPAKREAFDKVVAYLRTPAVQGEITRQTSRRPAVPGSTLEPRFPMPLQEATFPANLSVVQTLLDDYQARLRRPAHTIYVLDQSGSMAGGTEDESQPAGPTRMEQLKAALTGLAGADTSFSGRFSHFNAREKVTLIAFSGEVEPAATFTVDSDDPSSKGLSDIRAFVDGMQPTGATAIYSALQVAHQEATRIRASDSDAYVSIVLMTDGENTDGISARAFLDGLGAQPAGQAGTRIFTVLFGEANADELKEIADETGGQVFDARTAPLAQVFKEIRGYQ